MRKNSTLFTGLLVGASLLPAMAMAQETTDDTAAADASDDVILVTAQRRSEDVLKVPISVTVVGQQELAQRGVNDLNGVSKLAPSLQVAQDNTFSVRGIGTGTFANTVESSVSQVVDDVVLGNREFASNAFYDVARVEVLNGPQGLLFGKNASAGLVNITTNRPKLGLTTFAADGEVVRRARPGKDGTGYQVRSTLNVPIGEDAAARFNVLYGDQDPVTVPKVNPAVRNDLSLENLGLRAKVLFEPTTALSIYLAGDYNRQRGITTRYDITFREFGANSQYPGLGLVAGTDNLNFGAEAPNYRDSDTGGVQANISYELDNGMELVSVSAWKTARTDYQFDSDQTSINFFSYNMAEGDYDQYSQELRLALPSGNRLSGQMGLYYFRSDSEVSGFRGGNNGFPDFIISGFPFCIGAPVTAGPPPACNVSNSSFLGQDYAYTLQNTSYAAFGQLSYQLTDTLKLTGGARLTREKAAINLSENFGNYFVTLGVPRNVSEESTKATDLSYKIGLDWQATPDVLVYGFYGEGFKGPGFFQYIACAGCQTCGSPRNLARRRAWREGPRAGRCPHLQHLGLLYQVLRPAGPGVRPVAADIRARQCGDRDDQGRRHVVPGPSGQRPRPLRIGVLRRRDVRRLSRCTVLSDADQRRLQRGGQLRRPRIRRHFQRQGLLGAAVGALYRVARR